MIMEVKSGELSEICFKKLHLSDVKKYGLYKKYGWFKWSFLFKKKENLLYGIFIQGNDNIQGVIAVQKHVDNQLVHIELIEAAPMNKFSSSNQLYSGVGKCLLCFAMHLSIQWGFGGFVGLHAKLNNNEDYYRKLGALQSQAGIPPYYYFTEDISKNLLQKYIPGGVQWC